jgi:hypothetical protein
MRNLGQCQTDAKSRSRVRTDAKSKSDVYGGKVLGSVCDGELIWWGNLKIIVVRLGDNLKNNYVITGTGFTT